MQVLLSKNIAAIPLERDDDGQEQLGTICQLPFGAELHVCGMGFDSRTVKVGFGGRQYFVFIQDVREGAGEAGPRITKQTPLAAHFK